MSMSIFSSPKPVFNGRKHQHHGNMRSHSSPPQQPYPVQHEDIVKYLSDCK